MNEWIYYICSILKFIVNISIINKCYIVVIDDFYGWENLGLIVDDKVFILICKYLYCCFYLFIFFWYWLKILNFKIGLLFFENVISVKWIFWIVVVWVKIKN